MLCYSRPHTAPAKKCSEVEMDDGAIAMRQRRPRWSRADQVKPGVSPYTAVAFLHPNMKS